MFAKRFFYVSAGLLCLALAYHFGATSATAQAPGNPIVGEVGEGVLCTANGDVYVSGGASPSSFAHWVLAGNVFSGGPVPTQHETFGSLKSRYRGAPGAAQPTTQDR